VQSEEKMKYNQSAGLVQMVFAFLSRPSVESKEKKMRNDPSAGLVQTVQSAQEIFLGRLFFVTTANADMNPVHGELRGPSMVCAVPG
jgi:hypothetical protein